MSTGGLVACQVFPATCSNIRLWGTQLVRLLLKHPNTYLPATPKQAVLELCWQTPGHRNVTMAKNKGSGAKTLKEDKTGGNAKGKGKGKGKTGGKDEKDTESGTKKGFNEINVRHILW